MKRVRDRQTDRQRLTNRNKVTKKRPSEEHSLERNYASILRTLCLLALYGEFVVG